MQVFGDILVNGKHCNEEGEVNQVVPNSYLKAIYGFL